MLAGDCLGEKYELIRVLGRGGMGTVWLSCHRTLGTPCAVKVLGGAFEPARVSRALREARVAARLESDHAVRMLDAGTDGDGRPWLAMEHLRGHDLAAVLALHGPLALPRAAALLLGVCDAVAEAHHRGVVHRDLKPANLFLAERDDGSSIIKVLDFGIAKLLDEADPEAGAVTASGAMIGSPRYVAPEQIRSAAAADARADIWSLGVTLYELLAGSTPFVGDNSASVLARIMADPVPPLSERVPGLPPALLAIVDRCLQKDPGRRYPSVAKLAVDLAPFAPEADRRVLARILGWTSSASATTEDDPNVRPAASVATTPAMDEAQAALGPTPSDTAATWSTRERDPGPRSLRARASWPLAIGAAGALLAGSFAASFFAERRAAPAAIGVGAVASNAGMTAATGAAATPAPPAPAVATTSATQPAGSLPSASTAASAEQVRPPPVSTTSKVRPNAAIGGEKPRAVPTWTDDRQW